MILDLKQSKPETFLDHFRKNRLSQPWISLGVCVECVHKSV